MMSDAGPEYSLPAEVHDVAPARLAKAQDAVHQRLKDPGSAHFEELKISGAADNNGVYQRVVCGLVNAKNATGGYAGRTPFVYFVDLDRVDMTANCHLVDGFINPFFSEGSPASVLRATVGFAAIQVAEVMRLYG